MIDIFYLESRQQKKKKSSPLWGRLFKCMGISSCQGGKFELLSSLNVRIYLMVESKMCHVVDKTIFSFLDVGL